ncbi:hypothetical protein TNCT_717211 [Trichonephila clavata]|uniref:Uncharacterized protein n=1 Tax=Trichonephila clavata TaxID=2740835 RepID=A0A8X6GLM0_TRICU|nr:hypothetical protein TNCT_717211 [Trichonephila clavata]
MPRIQRVGLIKKAGNNNNENTYINYFQRSSALLVVAGGNKYRSTDVNGIPILVHVCVMLSELRKSDIAFGNEVLDSSDVSFPTINDSEVRVLSGKSNKNNEIRDSS